MKDHEEIRAVVAVVLEEQQDHVRAVAKEAVEKVLVSLGIHDDEDRKEIRKDFAHLRKWRLSVESAQSLTFKAVVTTLVGGVLGVLWLGVKIYLGK